LDKNITTPSILPGFMELLPADQLLFNRMLDTIRATYEKFGFIPLDTPTIEKSEILLAKSGGETEKQIYRFNKGENDLSLRFDLTVPLARYVAQHYNDLVFPFRRYHIGKVFRGERPQRGRFREFYQCDIDIIGNETLSIINDAEILSVIYSTFKALGFEDFTLRINNRKVLNGFFDWLEIENKADVLRIVDKIEKIDRKQAIKEFKELGLTDDKVDKIMNFIGIKGDSSTIIGRLKDLMVDNDLFRLGLVELEEVCGYIGYFGIPKKNFTLDITIARGLDYYTGTIYETILNDHTDIGSVCSGGRYDNLAENYTNKKLPGVGISIGLTRLFYKLREEGIISNGKKSTPTMLLIIPMEGIMNQALDISTKIRKNGIPTEVYFNEGKMGKKFTYANKLGIPFALVIGEDEIKSGKLKLKNMSTGEQEDLELEIIIRKLMDEIKK
jgi:histidyl-tRNA synthetase